MTTSISRRTVIPALIATGVASSAGAAAASTAATNLISLQTIEKANGLIRDRNALVDFVRDVVDVGRLNIAARPKEMKEKSSDSIFTFYGGSHFNLNDGYDPAFKAIRDGIRQAAVAQLRRVEVKLTALGIDIGSDAGIDG